MAKKTVTLRFEEVLYKRLQAEAEADHRTTSAYIELLLLRALGVLK